MTHPVHKGGRVGARFPKVDGPGKADGSGIYADDIRLPRMLHAKMLRSPHANARIRGIDVSEAEKYPGVVATLVGAEMPAKYGVIPWTHDEQALERRATEIEERPTELEELPAVVDAEAALRAANAKFERRFATMESLARTRGLDLKSLSAAEWDALWREAKLNRT